MGSHQPSRSSSSTTHFDVTTDFDLTAADVDFPFDHVKGLTRADLREASYEIFFMCCRAGARGGGQSYYPTSPRDGGGGRGDGSPTIGSGPKGGTGMNVVNSRVKKALGLKARRSTQPMMVRALSQPSAPGSPGRARRPMTSAEIMRQQMRVAEHGDSRLRKTLMRTLVGQVGRRAETIILPLELLRQLKPADFTDSGEYHQWQLRQLRLLEAGLISHPSLPLDRQNAAVLRFREVMRAAEGRAIDTGKASDAMRALCNAVFALAWRFSPGGGPPADACQWADGYPLNVLLYISLLRAVFDLKEDTVVLDEVDELLELIKRTWTTLGINRMVHNVCFAWVLFHQYVATMQVEPDLAGAALAMLADVAVDVKQGNSDAVYARVLTSALGAIQQWSEKRLFNYHESYEKSIGGAATESMESVLSLALATSKILAETVPSRASNVGGAEREGGSVGGFVGNRVDYYVRTSMRNAFTKILENGFGHGDSMVIDGDDDPNEILTSLAKDTEQLALSERMNFSPVLKRWHPCPGAVAVVTLHSCFGVVLKQYLAKVACLTNELVRVLHSAGRLEKAMVQMMVEDVAESDDGGKIVVREMVPYDVESIVVGLLKTWMNERLRIGKDCLLRAKETESWISKSKNEPFAQSAIDLMKMAKATIDEFFAIPVRARDDMVHDLASGLGTIFLEYISLVASCGTKQNYLPSLPPLTRCNQDSRIFKLWRKAATPCRASVSSQRGRSYYSQSSGSGGHNPRPSTSRGTQRLYVRLNTLHYLLNHMQALDKSLSFFSRGRTTSPSCSASRRLVPSYNFDLPRTTAQSAIGHVAEVAAYRLIFLDSRHSFYDGLYVGSVTDARIRPALRTLKQNLSLQLSVLVDIAQPVAVRELMKTSFEAFLMVLLAGGSDRSFTKEDYDMVEEDFQCLKRAFCTCGEGLVAEEVVESEAGVVEGILALMGQSTQQLMEEFGIVACETSGLGAAGQRLPMPPTTRRWHRGDPNTILRVLCYRDDVIANQFLKRTFQLPRRR